MPRLLWTSAVSPNNCGDEIGRTKYFVHEQAKGCHFIVTDADKDRSVVPQQLLEQLQPRVHHAAPLVVAAVILALLPDDLADPLLELRLRQVVVVDPALVAGVVRRVDVDALDPAGVRRQKRLEG